MNALGAVGLPGAACPAAAAALATTGLGPVCQVAASAGAAASQVAGFGVSSVLDALGGWVAEGASWLLTQIGSVIGTTTGIDLGSSWFGAHYGTMAELAGLVIVPLLLLGIVQSIYRQNLSALLRSVLVNVPLAILLTAVAVKLVQLGLSVTDAMSSAVAHGAGLDTGHFMASVLTGLSAGSATGQPSAPAFLMFLGALAVVVGAVLVWVELLVRAAAVYVAVLFLPLALASLAWPAIAHWCRRLVDTLVALVLGKFVIVSVLSLAAGALAAGTGSAPTGPTGGAAGDGGAGGGGFTTVLGGAALLLLSAFAPWALFRLLPFVEAGAVGHLEGLGRRATQTATVPIRGLAQTALRVTAAGALTSSGASMVGGALGGSAAGTGSGPSARRAPGSLGTGGPGGAVGGVPGGRRVPPGAGPDLGPSSAGITGVGSTSPPGYGIPMYPIHPEATAVANGHGSGDEDRVGAPPGSRGTPATPAELRPLPRQTGALVDDYLGRDRLGIKLISVPRARTDRTEPPGPAGG
jgi:hypothetical protein